MSVFNRGQMLIVVLWVMGLVSVAIGTLAVRSTHEVRLGRFPLEALQRRAIGQAGLEQAIRVIQQDTQDSPQTDTLQEPWATGRDAAHTAFFEGIGVGEGAFSVGRLEDGTFVPGLIDEERKLNLNVAAPEHIRRLIELVHPNDVDAQAVAAAIVDWRDEPVGPSCEGLNPPCHNGLFESVDELRAVPDMTPELFAVLEPYVTIYGSGLVNVNTAPATVLSAMGYPGEELVERRKTQPFESYQGLAVTSSAFSVPVEAELAHGSGRLHLAAVIDRAGCVSPREPDKRCILAWLPR